jgi:hypothetical protein
MKKIGITVREIMEGNPLLHFGFHHRLLNLSQVARFIRPLVEARTRKSVSDSAILMSLSRMQSKLVPADTLKEIVLDKISIHSGLCSLTILKTIESLEELNNLFATVRKRGRFITITEGVSEVTAILEDMDFQLAKTMFSEKLRYVQRDLASVGVKFSEETIANPGAIYQMVQQLTLQNINIIEVVSTATEFNIYVKNEDVRLAFDSIFNRFSTRAGGISDI